MSVNNGSPTRSLDAAEKLIEKLIMWSGPGSRLSEEQRSLAQGVKHHMAGEFTPRPTASWILESFSAEPERDVEVVEMIMCDLMV